jgi:hypothetical protein
MAVLKSPTNRRPRMAIVSSTLARIKADPLAYLGGAERVNQLFALRRAKKAGQVRQVRDRSSKL